MSKGRLLLVVRGICAIVGGGIGSGVRHWGSVGSHIGRRVRRVAIGARGVRGVTRIGRLVDVLSIGEGQGGEEDESELNQNTAISNNQ